MSQDTNIRRGVKIVPIKLKVGMIVLRQGHPENLYRVTQENKGSGTVTVISIKDEKTLDLFKYRTLVLWLQVGDTIVEGTAKAVVQDFFWNDGFFVKTKIGPGEHNFQLGDFKGLELEQV